jgi:peptidoglycan hydrolase CwlO-like protein
VRIDDLAAIRSCDNVKDDIIDLLTVMQNRFEHERYLTKLEKEVKRIQKKIHALDAQVNRAFENITSVRAKPLRGVSAEVI